MALDYSMRRDPIPLPGPKMPPIVPSQGGSGNDTLDNIQATFSTMGPK